MTKKRTIILFFAAVAFFAAAALGFLFFKKTEQPIMQTAKNNYQRIPILDIFYDKENFVNAEAMAKDTKTEVGVKAVVVPHHLLASRLVADALARAKGSNYSRIVIVGPNHDDRGADVVTSSAIEYDTPVGVVLPDEEKINLFRTAFACRAGSDVFLGEHSIGAIVPFVAEAFPNVKIIPIIISSHAGDLDARKLADWLRRLPADTLVIFSVDFSHYKTEAEADVYDQETASALMSRDNSKIEGWGNEHIDSPFTIATMLLYAEKIGANINIVANKNANDFLSQKVDSTTSYFEIVASR